MFRISESTRWTLRTVAGDRVFDSAVTHFCTSAWETLELNPVPLGSDVLADYPRIPFVGGRLEVGLVVEPVSGPVPHRDPREHRVDEGPGVLRRFDVRKESLSVGLAVKGLVALLTGWCPVVRTP